MRKAYNTSVDEEILEQFKQKCKEDGFSVSFVMEQFMKMYLAGEFEIVIRKKNDGK